MALFSNFGSDFLSAVIDTADTLGLTNVSPTTITYKGSLTMTGGPDTGYTEVWGVSGSISDVLIGHYSEKMIEASAGKISSSDIMAVFKTSELSAEPQAGDIIEWDSTVYEYEDFQEVAGLYAIRLSEREATNE